MDQKSVHPLTQQQLRGVRLISSNEANHAILDYLEETAQLWGEPPCTIPLSPLPLPFLPPSPPPPPPLRARLLVGP
jgi:hypothetical protein